MKDATKEFVDAFNQATPVFGIKPEIETPKPKIPRCTAAVYHRDTYRRTGRTKSGFEMHYTQSQCVRRATRDGRCWQHPKDHGFGDYKYADEFMRE
jgi:hypothetical protein